MSDLHTIWERIEAWYAAQGASHLLNPGASEEAITEAEKQIGVQFPEELRESLRRHNGTGGSGDWGWIHGNLNSIREIIEETKMWHELSEVGEFEDNDEHDASQGQNSIKRGWWNRGWIHVDADGLGNGAVVDMSPGPNGVTGQIIDMDHEAGPSGPNFLSFKDYLLDVANKLDTQEYTYQTGSIRGRE